MSPFTVANALSSYPEERERDLPKRLIIFHCQVSLTDLESFGKVLKPENIIVSDIANDCNLCKFASSFRRRRILRPFSFSFFGEQILFRRED